MIMMTLIKSSQGDKIPHQIILVKHKFQQITPKESKINDLDQMTIYFNKQGEDAASRLQTVVLHNMKFLFLFVLFQSLE